MNGRPRAVEFIEVVMQILVLSATLAGSLGTAWVIQRAILDLCVKAIVASNSTPAAKR
jgi:hypothetical protein